MKPKHEIPWRRHKEVAERYKREEWTFAKIKEQIEQSEKREKELEVLKQKMLTQASPSFWQQATGQILTVF